MQVLTAGTGNVYGIAFAPDGGAVAVLALRHAPQLWDIPATGSPVALTDSKPYRASGFSFAPDARAASWVYGNTRSEFARDTNETRLAPLLSEPNEFLLTQHVTASGRVVARTRNATRRFSVRALDPDGAGGWREVWHVGPAEHLRGTELAVAAGRVFAVEEGAWEAPNSQLVARDLGTGAELARVQVPTRYLAAPVATPDGSRLIGYWGSSLYFWDFGAPKMAKARTGTLRHYRSIAIHPDGRHLLAGNNDTTARVIDTHTWRVVKQFTWKVGRLTAVAVSPDGTLAAAGGEKGQVVLWDLEL